ncbi:cytochrome P450 [Podospora didyma]|uniref:Cytochrome P450 n=1 Tax=Podospora didyma TaxID=330526 RepID=A0AAE0KIV1_9PEZI|nr:cytochrome P450 [Podospora didyma]
MLEQLFLAALPLLFAYLFAKVRYSRFKQYASFPQLKPSLVWGHMKAINDFTVRGKLDRHIDDILGEMSDELGNPPFLMLDVRPAARAMLVITSHDVAEQISKSSKLFPWSVTKSPTFGPLEYIVGSRSILIKEGMEWKNTRKTYNPGFAPQHLMSLLPCILDKAEPFVKNLDHYARSGETFRLDELTIGLTFDIIGAVVMDTDFDAQHLDKSRRGELIQLFNKLTHTYQNFDGQLPWWFYPRREYRRWRLSVQIDRAVKNIIRQKFEEQQQRQQSDSGHKLPSRSVLALSLQGTDKLTEGLLSSISDQVKTFMFAGHDTTAILLGWIFYDLSRTPGALKTVRAELDEIFGPDPDTDSVRSKLLSKDGEDMVRRMSYISAVIKETLRLHPPAASARYSAPGTGFVVRTPQGDDVCLDGIVLYNCHKVIQRDRAVYGETANDFMPERWLGDSDTSMEDKDTHSTGTDHKKIPASAWRPFERGPRNCIGQELANIEARVIIAVVARRYDIVKIGMGEVDLDEKGQPTLNEKGQYKVKSELYSTQNVTAKAVDGNVMKVRLAPKASGAT